MDASLTALARQAGMGDLDAAKRLVRLLERSGAESQEQAYLVSTEGERHEDRLPECILFGPEELHLQEILKLVQRDYPDAEISQIHVSDEYLDYDPTGKQYNFFRPYDDEDEAEFPDGEGMTFLVEKLPTVRV